MKSKLAVLLLVALIIIGLGLTTGFIQLPVAALDAASKQTLPPVDGLKWFAQWF